MYFEDLSPYQYGVYYGHNHTFAIDEVLNVGWLENGQEYTKGEVNAEILLRLEELLTSHPNIVIQHRGYHFCDYCEYEHDNIPIFALQSRTIKLGSQVMWIPSPINANLHYAFPNLIYHYITEHNYHPPDEFLYAVEHATIDPDWNVSEYRQSLIEKNREQIRREEGID